MLIASDLAAIIAIPQQPKRHCCQEETGNEPDLNQRGYGLIAAVLAGVSVAAHSTVVTTVDILPCSNTKSATAEHVRGVAREQAEAHNGSPGDTYHSTL